MSGTDFNVDLPERRSIKLRNEVDRYGFSWLLAERLGLAAPPRSFGAWIHGWPFWEVRSAEELGYGGAPLDMPIVTRSMHEKQVLERHGFERVEVGGLPFAYTKPSSKERRRDSLLAFVPHSLAHLRSTDVPTAFFDYVDSIKRDFEHTYLCLFGHDEERTELVAEMRRRNLKFISGARPEDANSLFRMRCIFEQFEFEIGSGMGSHLLYGAFCGCKVSLPGPFLPENPDQYKRDPYLARRPALLERLLDTFEESTNREQYPWLFVGHPREARTMQEWANQEIGIRYLLDRGTIVSMLGWSVVGQIRGAIRGARRRFARGLDLTPRT